MLRANEQRQVGRQMDEDEHAMLWTRGLDLRASAEFYCFLSFPFPPSLSFRSTFPLVSQVDVAVVLCFLFVVGQSSVSHSRQHLQSDL